MKAVLLLKSFILQVVESLFVYNSVFLGVEKKIIKENLIIIIFFLFFFARHHNIHHNIQIALLGITYSLSHEFVMNKTV